MTLIGFLVLLAIAAICGAIGQSLAGYNLGGCLVSIILGFIWAYIGMWLSGKLGLPEFFYDQYRRQAISYSLGRDRFCSIYFNCGIDTKGRRRRNQVLNGLPVFSIQLIFETSDRETITNEFAKKQLAVQVARSDL